MLAKKSILLLFFVLAALGLNAQVGYTDQYYGAGNRGMRQSPREEAKPLTPEEVVAQQMPKLTEALELDEFEQAILSSVLTKYAKKHSELIILQLPNDKMREAMDQLKKDQQAELESSLPAEKYKMLVELQENGFKKRKGKKRKKSKN